MIFDLSEKPSESTKHKHARADVEETTSLLTQMEELVKILRPMKDQIADLVKKFEEYRKDHDGDVAYRYRWVGTKAANPGDLVALVFDEQGICAQSKNVTVDPALFFGWAIVADEQRLLQHQPYPYVVHNPLELKQGVPVVWMGHCAIAFRNPCKAGDVLAVETDGTLVKVKRGNLIPDDCTQIGVAVLDGDGEFVQAIVWLGSNEISRVRQEFLGAHEEGTREVCFKGGC